MRPCVSDIAQGVPDLVETKQYYDDLMSVLGLRVLDEPAEFPQYGPQCFATCWLDPHGIKLEAVCHSPEEA